MHGRPPTRWSSRLVLVSLIVLSSGLIRAADTEPPSEPPADPQPAIEEHVEVLAGDDSLEVDRLEADELDAPRIPNVAGAVLERAGVHAVRRGQDALEPVIRGLGWERVQTTLDGLPLYGACPGRMDPPSSILAPGAVEEVDLVRGLASVGLGPGATGGALVLSTRFERPPGEPDQLRPWTGASFDSARSGWSGSAGVEGGLGDFDFRLGGEQRKMGDYESASGVTVPARHEERGAHATVGWQIDDRQRVRLSLLAQDGDRVDYPALPMDARFLDARTGTLRYRLSSRTGLPIFELRAGHSAVDHGMDNRYKPNRSMLEAETDSIARSSTLGLVGRWRFSPRAQLAFGVDAVELERDALRTRRIVSTGQSFQDHLWPDPIQRTRGLFAEALLEAPADWQLRLGVRFDRVESRARAADDPGLGGVPIRQQYVRFYGPDAAITDRDESHVGGNLLATRALGHGFSLQVGLGRVVRAAGVTERYFAFAPAPGGFLVGNPTLRAEAKHEAALALRHRSSLGENTLRLFHYDFDDYLLPTVLATTDVNGDGIADTIRGTVNTDATLYGMEWEGDWRLSKRFSLPGSLAWVRGEDDRSGRPLPEIPPLELRLAGRLRWNGEVAGHVELGARFADEQRRVDPEFGEDATPSFTVVHLRSRLSWGRGWTLDLGIENLLDRDYHEHLTREAVLPVGGLATGDEVPQPGRSLSAGLRFQY